MNKQKTHYDKIFKENAVKLSLERKNVSARVCAYLNILSPGIMYLPLINWNKTQKKFDCFYKYNF